MSRWHLAKSGLKRGYTASGNGPETGAHCSHTTLTGPLPTPREAGGGKGILNSDLYMFDDAQLRENERLGGLSFCLQWTATFAVLLFGKETMSGTNAVTTLADNVTNATNTAWPLVIVIITGLIALSVFLKIGRRGGVRA